MSSEIFLKDQMRALLASSKKDTGKKFITFNDNITDMFNQVDVALAGLTNRISELENNSGGSSSQANSQVLFFYFDEQGNICQGLGNIDKNFYVPAGMFVVDDDGDLCQVIKDEEEEETGING